MSHLYVKRELTQKFKARTVPKLETSDVKTQLTFFMKQHVTGHRVRGGVYGTCAWLATGVYLRKAIAVYVHERNAW